MIKHQVTPQYILYFFVLPCLLGGLCGAFIVFTFLPFLVDKTPVLMRASISSALLFTVGVHGLIFINNLLSQTYDLQHQLDQRIRKQIIFSIVWTICLIICATTPAIIIKRPEFIPLLHIITFASIICGLLSILYSIALIFRQVIQDFKSTIKQIEKVKRDKLEADYKVLQNQLNPHFLFNNLNILVSQIRSSPSNAIAFTEELSTVYRYVLESKSQKLVTLAEELTFLNSFIYLQKVKFGDGLQVICNIDVDDKSYYIPPMSVQLLLENAIKHNIVDEDMPLTIKITSLEKAWLLVSNPLHPKRSTYSTSTGLSNLKARYQLIGEKMPKIEKLADRFNVYIPLITV